MCSSPRQKVHASAERKAQDLNNDAHGFVFALCACGEEVKGHVCGGNNGTHESLFAAPPVWGRAAERV